MEKYKMCSKTKQVLNRDVFAPSPPLLHCLCLCCATSVLPGPRGRLSDSEPFQGLSWFLLLSIFLTVRQLLKLVLYPSCLCCCLPSSSLLLLLFFLELSSLLFPLSTSACELTKRKLGDVFKCFPKAPLWYEHCCFSQRFVLNVFKCFSFLHLLSFLTLFFVVFLHNRPGVFLLRTNWLPEAPVTGFLFFFLPVSPGSLLLENIHALLFPLIMLPEVKHIVLSEQTGRRKCKCLVWRKEKKKKNNFPNLFCCVF